MNDSSVMPFIHLVHCNSLCDVECVGDLIGIDIGFVSMIIY